MVFTFEFGQSRLSPPDVRPPVGMGEHLAPVECRPHALRVERRLHDRRALTPDAGQFAERHVAPLVRLAGLARRPPRCIRPGSPLHVIREAFRAFGHPALGQTWRAIRPAPGSHRTPAHVETSDRFWRTPERLAQWKTCRSGSQNRRLPPHGPPSAAR